MLRPTYPILTERLLLRPFTDGDLDSVHDIERREDVTRYLYWGPRSRADVRDALAQRIRMTSFEAEGDAIRLAAELRTAGSLVGDFSLRWLSREHALGEIGFVLHPDHQGRGYGAEAGRLMLELGFVGLGLHRVIGRCDARNAASARLMERLGMRLEAHLRENEFVKGEWCDELDYAILTQEWVGRR